MTRESRCLNSNHGRANPQVRCCPNCGETVNEMIPVKKCSDESHGRRRMDMGRFCPDCGQRLR